MRGWLSSSLIRVGGACGPPPPVAAALASSLRAPSRGDPPLRGRGVGWLPPGSFGQARRCQPLRALACRRPRCQTPVIRRGPGRHVAGRSDQAEPRYGTATQRGVAARKERVASLRAQQRLAAGGRRLPRPVVVRATQGAHARRNSSRPDHAAGGRRGKERAASLRAQQRLAAGGRRLPRPG